MLALFGTDDTDRILSLTGARTLEADVIERDLLRGRPETYQPGVGSLDTVSVSDHERTVVAAASVAHLRRALPLLGRYGRSRDLTVVVLSTDRPNLLSLPSSLTQSLIDQATLHVVDGGEGGIVIRLTLRRRASVQEVVRALLTPPTRAGSIPSGAGLRLGLTDASGAAWAAGDPVARTVTARTLAVDTNDIPPVDVVVGPEVRAEPPAPFDPPSIDPKSGQRSWAWAATAAAEDVTAFAREAGADLVRPGVPWSVPAPMLPPVDIKVISPCGFVTKPSETIAHSRRRADRAAWDILDDAERHLTTLAVDQGIGEDAIARLRKLRYLVIDPGDSPGPVDAAALLATLATAGVPVRLSGSIPDVTRTLLGPVASALEAMDESVANDDIAREAWSVHTRRQALLRFSPSGLWQALGDQLGRTTASLPSFSVILATKRPGNIAFALTQIDRQSWPELEVVVALHGVPATHPAIVDAVARQSRPVQVVEVESTRVFGDVLNAALDRCSGRFVAKMDDDDWYGPHHLTDLLLAHAYSSASLVGLADHYVYLAHRDLTVRDVAHGTERPASRVSGGTLSIARDDLLAVGRWRPVRRAVDRCLIQAVKASGGHLYAIHDQGFCLFRGTGDHTWDPGDNHFVARDPMKWPGFVPPPQLDPIPHPAMTTR
jgi:hypothetical protein